MKLPKYVREKLLTLFPDSKLETKDDALRELNKFLAQYQLDGILDDDIITLTQMVVTFYEGIEDTDIVDKEFCSYFEDTFNDIERLQDDIREYQKQTESVLSARPKAHQRKDLQINRYKGHRARLYLIEKALANKCPNYYITVVPSGIIMGDKRNKKNVLKYSEIFEYNTIIYGSLRFYQPNEVKLIEDIIGSEYVHKRACRAEPNQSAIRMAYYKVKEVAKIILSIYSYNNEK